MWNQNFRQKTIVPTQYLEKKHKYLIEPAINHPTKTASLCLAITKSYTLNEHHHRKYLTGRIIAPSY